jgi:ribulose-5-phosphate 4-epimerase/fuculose-1-phosphate aldolase
MTAGHELVELRPDGSRVSGPRPSEEAFPHLAMYRADPALGPGAEAAAARHHALLLTNHGPAVAATDLATAADAIEELEETARPFLLLHDHPTRPLRDDQADRLRKEEP